MKIAKFLLAFYVITMAAAQAASAPATVHKYQPVEIWEWQENVITDPSAQSAFFAFATTHGINRVYVECESAIRTINPRSSASWKPRLTTA